MAEDSINERLKFLIEKYGLSVRAFSAAIGATDTNTRNYIDRGSKPNAEYLGKLLKRFNDINPTWLLLGEGEPFRPGTTPPLPVPTTAHLPTNPGTSSGAATQPLTLEACQRELEATRRDAAGYQREIELLKGQMADKNEIITLLRGGSHRPN